MRMGALFKPRQQIQSVILPQESGLCCLGRMKVARVRSTSILGREVYGLPARIHGLLVLRSK